MSVKRLSIQITITQIIMAACLVLDPAYSLAKISSPFNASPNENASAIREEFIKRLREMLKQLEPLKQDLSPAPINAATYRFIIDVSGEEVRMPDSNDGTVTRIEAIFHNLDFFVETDPERRKRSMQIHMLCTFSDNTQQLFAFRGSVPSTSQSLIRTFVLMGGYHDLTYFYPSIHKTLISSDELNQRMSQSTNAENNSTPEQASENTRTAPDTILATHELFKDESNYTEKEQQAYQWLRKTLSELLLIGLNEHPNRSTMTAEAPLLIVSLGSGSGKDLETAQNHLKENGIDSQTYGIEKNSALIPELNPLSVNQGDALNSAQLILSEKAERGIPPSAFTLIMASGFLNRGTLRGPYEALQVLQELIQTNVADMIVIGGLSNSLVNMDIASAAGWTTETTSMINPDLTVTPRLVTAFLLTRPTFEDQLNRVEARSRSRSNVRYTKHFTTLDLSMSGVTFEALRHYHTELSTLYIREIDLSWSYLTTEQTHKLFDPLFYYSKLDRIIVSGHEPWYSSLITAAQNANFKKPFKIVRRLDNKYPHELPSFPPDIARMLNQYDELPVITVFDNTMPVNNSVSNYHEKAHNPESRSKQNPLIAWETRYSQKPTASLLQHNGNSRSATSREPSANDELSYSQPSVAQVKQDIQTTPAAAHTSQWQADIAISHLTPENQSKYSDMLLATLDRAHIELMPTAADGACFFHALASQLTIDGKTHDGQGLQAIVASYISSNENIITESFPAYAGEQFQLLQQELDQAGVWGNFGLIPIIALMTNRRIVVFYPSAGELRITAFNGNGEGLEELPADLNDDDVFMVHNGQSHWLAALRATGESSESFRVNNSNIMSGAFPNIDHRTFSTVRPAFVVPIVFSTLADSQNPL